MITPKTAAKPTVLAATLVNGDEVDGNLGVATSVSEVTGLITDNLNQIYVSGASETSTLAGGFGVLIRRVLHANLTVIAGTPFTDDYPPQVASGVAQVTPLGDISLGVVGTVNRLNAPNALVANGSANGVGFDATSNTSCFGGFVNQGIPIPATPTLPVNTNIIENTAFENDAALETAPAAGASNPFTAAGTSAGIVACATYNSNTIITVGGSTSNNPTFTFTQGVDAGTATNPAPQTFALVNFDPSFPNPTFNINGAPPGASGTIAGNYVPAVAAWLNYAVNGDAVTLSIKTSVTNNFDPGYYTDSFTVTPLQGDNAGVPQTHHGQSPVRAGQKSTPAPPALAAAFR